MTLRVSGKNLDIGEALRSQVQARMAGALSKYFDGGYSGHVTVTRDGAGFRKEALERAPRGARIGVGQREMLLERPFGLPANDRRRGRLSHRPRIIRGYRTRSLAEAGR